jgi:UDP-glucuronate decarboxylase
MVCTQGTLNILGLAKRTNARILLASTSEVYGDPEVKHTFGKTLYQAYTPRSPSPSSPYTASAARWIK